MSLDEEIRKLIQSKNEGEYWDFKYEHHTNKASLLHDILCMANSRFEFQNSYIIYGVEDGTGKIVGVENNPHRRSQPELAQFFSQAHFAGQNCPGVNVHVLQLEGHEVDVLEIVNDKNGPYYLEKDYSHSQKTVRAGYIYTRIGSMNTPLNRNADPGQIDTLWKKRYGLLLPPSMRLIEFAKDPGSWAVTNKTYYHKLQPEFTVTMETAPQKNVIPYFTYEDEPRSAQFFMIHAWYNATLLFSLRAVEYSSGKFIAVCPPENVLPLGGSNQVLKFNNYSEGCPELIIQRLIRKKQSGAAHFRLLVNVPHFKSVDQRSQFISHIQKEESDFLKLFEDFKKKISGVVGLDNNTQEIVDKLAQGKALAHLLKQFPY